MYGVFVGVNYTHAQITHTHTKQSPVSLREHTHIQQHSSGVHVCVCGIICMPISGHPVLSVTKRYWFHCLVWNSMKPRGMLAQ